MSSQGDRTSIRLIFRTRLDISSSDTPIWCAQNQRTRGSQGDEIWIANKIWIITSVWLGNVNVSDCYTAVCYHDLECDIVVIATNIIISVDRDNRIVSTGKVARSA